MKLLVPLITVALCTIRAQSQPTFGEELGKPLLAHASASSSNQGGIWSSIAKTFGHDRGATPGFHKIDVSTLPAHPPAHSHLSTLSPAALAKKLHDDGITGEVGQQRYHGIRIPVLDVKAQQAQRAIWSSPKGDTRLTNHEFYAAESERQAHQKFAHVERLVDQHRASFGPEAPWPKEIGAHLSQYEHLKNMAHYHSERARELMSVKSETGK